MDFKSLPRLRCAVPHLRAETACLNHARHQKWEESKAENPNRNSLFPFNDKAQCCFLSPAAYIYNLFLLWWGFSWLPIYLKWTDKCCEVTEFRQNNAYMFLLCYYGKSTLPLNSRQPLHLSGLWAGNIVLLLKLGYPLVESSCITYWWSWLSLYGITYCQRFSTGGDSGPTFFFFPYHEVTTNFFFSRQHSNVLHTD